MAGQQRVFRAKIRATGSLQKIFRAMELIAASRIGGARARAQSSEPYAREITNAVAAVASHGDVQHPLIGGRETSRVAILLLTADRGMAGAYNANVLRETERFVSELAEQGKETVIYTVGRRGTGYFQFRGRELERFWEGQSDSPTPELSREIADELVGRFLQPEEEGGVGELRIVFTQFINMVTQVPRVIRLLPLEVVDAEEGDGEPEAPPLYEFEPSAEEVLDALLPRYVQSRIYDCLLQAAASELAARQSAMHTATKNAEDIIRNYARLANSARQAEITQEISEIVSGADALAAGK